MEMRSAYDNLNGAQGPQACKTDESFNGGPQIKRRHQLFYELVLRVK